MLNLNDYSGRQEFGARIKKAREKNHKTQEALAEILNCSRTTISNWERGAGLPEPNIIPLLCSALSVDTGYLFGEYDASTVTIQKIIDTTGLSEPAINMLHNFMHHTLDLSKAEEAFSKNGFSKMYIEKIIHDTRKAHEPTITTEYPHILSLFLEHPNAANVLSLITRKVKGIHSYQNKSDSIYAIGGNLVRIDEDEALDFLIQTEITNLIRDIAHSYNKKTE